MAKRKMNADEACKAQLSALIKAHLPEDTPNLNQHMDQVIKNLSKPGAHERLKEAMAKADRASNLHRHVDRDALRSEITGIDHTSD